MSPRAVSGAGPTPYTYIHWLCATAQHRPDAVALSDPNITVTYGDLVQRMKTSARLLVAAGLQQGQPVCMAMTASADYAAWIFGCLLAGGVAAPVNTRLSGVEVAAYVDRLGPTLLVCDAVNSHLFEQAGVATMIVDEGSLVSDAESSNHEEVSIVEQLAALDEDGPSIIFPTGGTTGLPKGAYTDHRGLLTWAWNIAFGSRRHADETELFFSPFFHVSLMVGVFAALFGGGAIVIEPTFDAGRAIQLIADRGITRLQGSPTMYVALMNHPDASVETFALVRDSIFGASAATGSFVSRILAEFPNARITTGYGATELASGVSRVEDADLRDGRIEGVGRPNVGCEMRVIDKDGHDVEPGHVGDLIVRSPWQTLGYWRQPDETASTYRSDGFINLGDLARFDADGWLHIAGRSKEMIITGGENVYPIEVEQVLNAQPGVAEVVVFGVPDEQWGERVEAVVTAGPGTELDVERIRRDVRSSLAGYKVPKRIHVVDQIPLTPNNKPNRRALTARYTEHGTHPHDNQL